MVLFEVVQLFLEDEELTALDLVLVELVEVVLEPTELVERGVSLEAHIHLIDFVLTDTVFYLLL